MVTAGGLLRDRYRIGALIARGGMGAVYQAQDLETGATVAVKQLHLDDELFHHAFERETRILRGLRHVSLPAVIDAFAGDTGQILVMEYMPGNDLATMLIRQSAPFPAETVLAWAEQLLDALAYLHHQTPPVVHRDIKPANLKLRPSGDSARG